MRFSCATFRLATCLASILAIFVTTASAAEPAIRDKPPTPEQEEFFEARVRPLLVQHCQECHGADSQEADLRLDSRAALLRGSDQGPVVVPHDPDKSRLIAAVRYNGSLQMPPDRKLSERDLQTLVEWVRMGLPWPGAAESTSSNVGSATHDTKPVDLIAAARASHWSYQPVRMPALPAVQNANWCATPIDHFVLAELESHGLTPAARADRRTLLRRLSFDLVGLPPTYEDVEAFLADDSPDALATVIDRLLASPHYGERWGRHWLDIARYSDTKGYVFQEEPRYPFAYTYRDYVVDSLNEDLPFDQFIREQLAADLLPPRDDNRSLAALGFLTVGSRFSNNMHEIIDDRIDVVTRGLLGLTVSCARCHDHKYDAIPTADYYALYGVFSSCVEPKELPLIGEPEAGPAYEKFQQELASLQKEVDAFVAEQAATLSGQLRQRVGDLLAESAGDKLDKGNTDNKYVSGARDVRPPLARRWREFLARQAQKSDRVFAPWRQFVRSPAEQFAAQSKDILAAFQIPADGAAAQESPVNERLHEALVKSSPATLLDVVGVYDEVFKQVDQQWQAALAAARESNQQSPTELPDPAAEELRQVLYALDSPLSVKPEEAASLFDRATRNKHTALKRKVDAFKASSPAAPPRAMVLNDAPNPSQPYIFLRGNPARRGPAVPRQYLAVLSSDQRQPFAQGSGRLELAERIARRDNPLTARVIVNRVWQQHFGLGLVTTPSDFGARSEPPSHPALLDYLAATFMADGWSLKKLHRRIVLSSVYQQSSEDRPAARAVDPENRLLWRANRRRLEFEPMRDAMLAVSGQLDRTLGGRPVEISKPPYSTRRTIYGLIDRQDLPAMFRMFDFASPDVSTEQRPHTTVPQQALFGMNSPFVLEQARRLAGRAQELAVDNAPAEQVDALYRLSLARQPTDAERQAALAFIAAQPTESAKDQLSRREMLAQVLLLTNEFVFVD